MSIGNDSAFPIGPQQFCLKATPGLSKRELFAAMAMYGQLSAGEYLADTSHVCIASSSLKYADALLAELERADETQGA